MTSNRKYRLITLGVALLSTAVSSAALTLGRAHGAVLLGQPLKLSVPIRAESQEDAASACFEADVFYGDVKQDPAQVTVSRDFSVTSQSGVVEVTARVRVDEPVVTVYLRAGCEHKTTRRYVLLADPVSEVAPAPQREPIRSVLQPAALPALTASAKSDVSRPEPTEKLVKPTRKLHVAPSTDRAENTPILPLPERKPTATRRPRLKLAPVDLSVEHDLALKISSAMVVAETEDLQKRAEATALWRALNASPQDILNADSRRQSMEADLKSLQLVTNKNRQALQELTTRLERAESERYLNPVVYGLFAFLLLTGAGVVYGWLRLRQSGQGAAPWWRNDGASGHAGWGEQFEAVSPGRPAEPRVTEPVQPASPTTAPLTEVDIDLHGDTRGAAGVGGTEAHASTVQSQAEPSHAVSRAAGHVDFAHSMTASLRALNTQEMLDVRQQAEFFMTLGQHEEAISVLKDSISASADSNPLIYLELLRVLHTLGRKAEYDHYRADFNSIFSAHIPPYADFGSVSEGLESYPAVCQHICATWPSEEAVDYIEHCLLRSPGDDPTTGFDLEAFRDLLMLHGIARRMAANSESRLQPFSAARSMSAPGNPSPSAYVETRALLPESQHSEAVESEAISGATVDLDLSEPPGNLIDFNADELGTFQSPAARKPE